MKRRWMLALALLATGCATPGPNPSLESARSAVQSAASTPQVAQSAAVELAQAQESLHRAEAAWQGRADPAEVDHLAYLARQQALIATERGKLAEAQQTIANSEAERNRVLLEQRNRQLVQEKEAHSQTQSRAQAAEGAAAAQAQRAQQLQQELAALAAKQTDIGMVMTLSDVLFDVGKATLKPGAQRSLDRLAEFMKKYPERKIRIEGFTDTTGKAETNQELSDKRAEAVRDELAKRGISTERIEAIGYGPAFPVASNSTAAGRQRNRRVEIVISDEAGNLAKRH